MRVSVRSDIGLVRQTNQDSYVHRVFERGSGLDSPPVHVFGVADGMGGYQAGEVASRLALDVVASEVEKAAKAGRPLGQALSEAMIEANREVVRQGLSDPTCTGMGTTVTVALVSGGVLHVGHVGDSRAYIVRGGKLEQVTQDHSLVGELVRNGDITEEQAQMHPQRNILTQAFGSDLRVKPDLSTASLQDGDMVFLCTDGLTGAIQTAEIEDILAAAGDLDEAASKLVAIANERGGHDNVTVLVAGPFRLGGDPL
ncbi:MAG: Stp1/IreP family PP2C-type Ser/Thr phosphatase [Bacillota bacterium]|nr:MAG: Stp1/IreP family PP2C-type Ser/Thr phosphatase [Bacillota bacterium]